MKKKYDTAVVFLYATGREELLPEEFRKNIPYSTISTWRKTDYSKYAGHEFRYFFDEAIEKAELINNYTALKKLVRGISRTWLLLSSALKPLIREAKKDADMRENILRAIQEMGDVLGIDKALKLVGISRTLYQEWVLEARFTCTDSFTSLCVKRHPHQLAAREIFAIRNMLTDPDMMHWPIVSIAGLALRKKKMVASLYSWYKYARLLDITKKPPKKDRKTVGLISTKPNEYLHVDTTYYALSDETRVCITFVMDNYSKMILGYDVALHLSFAIVMNALSKAIEVIKLHPDQQPGILVADGGRENHNKEIDAFISKLSGYTLTKIRALKDIRFSNSPVEAIHRTIKSRYLRNRRFDSLQALSLYLDWAVKDYNSIRPHYKHRPRTPSEVYFNQPLGFDIKERMQEAKKNRVQKNKCSNCVECTCNG